MAGSFARSRSTSTIKRDVLARRAADVLHARKRLLDEINARYLSDA